MIVNKINHDTDLLPTLHKLIEQGMVEKNDNIFILTSKGRTDALLRWRGLNDDVKILMGLWLKEKYDSLDKGV